MLVATALYACSSEKTTGPPVTTQPAATMLAFTVQPPNAVAGAVLAPTVKVSVEDSFGNPVTSATNTVTLALETNSGGATLYGTTTVAAVNGVATFSDLSIQKAGNEYALTASSSSLASATSASFSISPAAAAQLAFTVQPSTTPLGQSMSPSVQVAIQDSFGNAVRAGANQVSLTIGSNSYGATLSGTTTATAVNGLATFANLSVNRAGSNYTLLATATGLTAGTSTAFSIPLTFASISAGYEHTCGITPAGSAYCWGLNNVGQLGNGTSGPQHCGNLSCSLAPLPVAGGLIFTMLSSGDGYTCGVTTAGAAYCWGGAGYQLGNSAGNETRIPVPVSGGLSFITVSAASEHTCGLTTTGAAYCWGYNSNGELGDGRVTDSPVPVAVTGGLTFAKITAGGAFTNDGFTCGLTAAGTAYCWGYNGDGRLGDSTTTNRTTPGLVVGGLHFSALSAGLHACGVTTVGNVYCWGDNSAGELGNATGIGSSTPVLMSHGVTFVDVSVREGNSCALSAVNTLYCWGYDPLGEVGDGTDGVTICSTYYNPCTPTPSVVTGGLSFKSVSAGWLHACGLSTTGAAYCWGSDAYFALGYPTTQADYSLTPGAVIAP